MSTEAVYSFPLVDEYTGIRMGVDLSRLEPGRVVVVETDLRLRREASYGYVRVLWWIWLNDGRTAISVPPGAGDCVRSVIHGVSGGEMLLDPELGARLAHAVNPAIAEAGLEPVDREFGDTCFACNRSLLRTGLHGGCRRLQDEGIPPAEGVDLPTHCFPDGIAYGVVTDGKVVSVAFAHRSGVMEDRVADVGVVTAAAYRRRGYGKAAVSAVVEHVAAGGGEARYACRPDNAASVATARSVGFVPYGTSLVLASPAKLPED